MFARIIRYRRRAYLWKFRQFRLVNLREISAAFMLFIEFHQLAQPHRRLDVGHIIFITFSGNVVPPDVPL